MTTRSQLGRRILSVTALAGLTVLVPSGTATAAPHSPVGLHSLTVSCVGDTLSGRVSLAGPVGAAVTLRLVGGHDLGHPQAVGAPTTVLLTSTSASYPFSFDLAGPAAKLYRVDASDSSGRVVGRSRALPHLECAPGTEVPEAPAAALVPLTLLGTAAAAAGARRRKRTVITAA